MPKEPFTNLTNLTDEEIKTLVDEILASPQDPATEAASNAEFDKLLAEDPGFSALIDRMSYQEKINREGNHDSFVGRVFVCTTMYRTTVNYFALVVDETNATAFYKRLGNIVASESDTQNGNEFPNLSKYNCILALGRKECERGRKQINNDSNGRSRLSFRSNGETWMEWNGEACYFDHLW